jgi:hypothetical protein
VKVLKIEPYTTYRKYKESTHMSLIETYPHWNNNGRVFWDAKG